MRGEEIVKKELLISKSLCINIITLDKYKLYMA